MADDIGVDAAGMNTGDIDIGVGQIMSQCVGKAQHGKFGGIIGGLSWCRKQAENGRYIGDMAAVSRHHMRQKGLCAMHNPPEINIHNPVEIIEG